MVASSGSLAGGRGGWSGWSSGRLAGERVVAVGGRLV